MAAQKGIDLEELVRAYFVRQGFFTLRSVLLRYEDEDVTDVDVWCYGRQSASVRTRTLIDVKNRRSPRAFERILWAKGLQLALRCDRAIVTTTDRNPKVVRFAEQQRIALISKGFLERLEGKIDTSTRLTLEQFFENIRRYPDHKYDGDWIRQISDAKSAVVSLPHYQAFNKCMGVFRFFAERVQTRPQHKEQAVRACFFAAALACISLDAALESVLYEDASARYNAIVAGVTYGDAGDAKVQNSIKRVLSVISEGMENGRVVARQANDALSKLFEKVRADIVAEHFSKEHNSAALFNVGRELDERAHDIIGSNVQTLTTDARVVIGVFSDFVRIKRTTLLTDGSSEDRKPQPTKPETEGNKQESEASMSEEKAKSDKEDDQTRLL